MKYLFNTVFFFSLYSSSVAQTDNKIVLGTIDSINSNILNEQRKIWVYVPNSGASEDFSKQRYPVVYLLDGEAHFYSVAGMIQQLSSVNGNTVCPEMIVVGIPNTDRIRDLTPTHVSSDPPFLDSNSSKSSGGGERFISFIEKELIPHVDSVYPTQPYRMLIGHSLGGLTVVNTLISHDSLFNAYVAIDPSMWWDSNKLLNLSKSVLAKRSYRGVTMYLGIANTMNPGMDTMKVKNDTAYLTKHIRAILKLNEYFNSNKQNELKYQGKYYGDDDHGSVPLIAEYDALHFIFSYYPMKLTMDDYMNIDMNVISKIERHYDDITRQLNYKVRIPENMANDFGHRALRKKHYAEAAYLFKLNIANYPESPRVYESIGVLYEAQGDKTKAIDNYKKSLFIKEQPELRKKLEKLHS